GGVAAALAFGALGLELVLAGACTSVLQQAGELRHLVGPGSFEAELFAESSGVEATVLARFAFFYALAAPLGEALHAVSGFALYLNRRTLAEGWDVELAFRRLAARASALVFALGLFAAPLALAEENEEDPPSAVLADA